MDDENIIRLFIDRDEAAIKQTAEKYGMRLRNISLGLTKDEQTAEECENDTYMTVWNKIPPAEPKTYFFAFLARIIRAISVDRIRKNTSLKRNGFITELNEELENCLPANDNSEDEIFAKELGESISRFLSEQSEEKQIIFVRRYFYFDSVSEIGARLHIGDSKVKTTLFRLRNGLREFLLKEGYDL